MSGSNCALNDERHLSCSASNCSGDREFFVKYVGDYYVVLADKREETTSTISNLRSLVKSDKDVIFDEVLSLWKSQSLDNAYDNKSSVVHLESFFNIVQDFFAPSGIIGIKL